MTSSVWLSFTREYAMATAKERARARLPVHHTPSDIATSLGINVSKVLGLIHSGELPAINVAKRTGGQPRWRISADDLVAFKAARAAVKPETAS